MANGYVFYAIKQKEQAHGVVFPTVRRESPFNHNIMFNESKLYFWQVKYDLRPPLDGLNIKNSECCVRRVS